MPDLVGGISKVTTHWLPGDCPIFTGFVVAYINIMPWSVKWNSVLPETRDTVVFS